MEADNLWEHTLNFEKTRGFRGTSCLTLSVRHSELRVQQWVDEELVWACTVGYLQPQILNRGVGYRLLRSITQLQRVNKKEMVPHVWLS